MRCPASFIAAVALTFARAASAGIDAPAAARAAPRPPPGVGAGPADAARAVITIVTHRNAWGPGAFAGLRDRARNPPTFCPPPARTGTVNGVMFGTRDLGRYPAVQPPWRGSLATSPPSHQP
jgi:hypothetical protein